MAEAGINKKREEKALGGWRFRTERRAMRRKLMDPPRGATYTQPLTKRQPQKVLPKYYSPLNVATPTDTLTT